MKKRIGSIITIIVIALLVCLLIWRFWPCSFSNAIPLDEDSVISFSALARIDRFENGQSYTDTYRIDTQQSQNGSVGEILEILNGSGYQQDYRNLLPWGIDGVSADKNYDGHTILLQFLLGDEKEEYINIQFLSSSIIAVSTGDVSGLRIYHPTNHETMYDLIAYLQTHGTKQ